MRALCKAWPRAVKYVDADGKLLSPWVDEGSACHPYWHEDLGKALWNMIPISLSDCHWTDADVGQFGDFVRRMLAWDEKARATTKELLEHGWLKAAGTVL